MDLRKKKKKSLRKHQSNNKKSKEGNQPGKISVHSESSEILFPTFCSPCCRLAQAVWLGFLFQLSATALLKEPFFIERFSIHIKGRAFPQISWTPTGLSDPSPWNKDSLCSAITFLSICRQEATAFVSQCSSGFSCFSVGTMTFLTTSRCTITLSSTRGPVCSTVFFPSITGRGASRSPLIQPGDSDGLPSGSNYCSTLRINNLHDNRLHSLMPSHTSSTLSQVLSDRWSRSPCGLPSYGFVLAIPDTLQHSLLGHSRYRADLPTNSISWQTNLVPRELMSI